jgi:hydroxyacylglutathione hydrolase
MEVIQILNKPIDSNSFIIYQEGVSNCIVVDPGTNDCLELFSFFVNHNLKPEYIFLTHEHFDHIWGVNRLKEIYSCNIVCSKNCSERIIDKKKNMSVFYDQVGFQSYSADILIENISFRLSWNNLDFEFFESKGHSEGSICISFKDSLFTGDTIIKNHKTVVKFPGGSRANLISSLIFLLSKFEKRKIKVYPGHGESFYLNEIAIEQLV